MNKLKFNLKDDIFLANNLANSGHVFDYNLSLSALGLYFWLIKNPVPYLPNFPNDEPSSKWSFDELRRTIPDHMLKNHLKELINAELIKEIEL